MRLRGYERERIEIDLTQGKVGVAIEIELEPDDCDDCMPFDERTDIF